MPLGSTTMRRWVGAAIAGLALAIGIFALLGSLTWLGDDVIWDDFSIPGITPTVTYGHGRWGVRVHGLVVTQTPNKALIAVPRALFCQTNSYRAWNNQCRDSLGESASDGAFDLTLDFTFETINDETVSWQEEESLMVVAPGCEPQELLVRDPLGPDRHHRRGVTRRRGTGLELVKQVTLDCSRRSEVLPPIPFSDQSLREANPKPRTS